MDMINSRNLSSHAYDEITAATIVSAILKDYGPEFEAFHLKMEQMKQESP